MRKRAQARKQVNHDDMWITVPGKASAEPEVAAEAAVRTETPTYEDTWYQVLRKRDDAPEGSTDDTVHGPDEEPAEAEDAVDEGLVVEAAIEPAPAEDDEPDVPARPDLTPQHASSLD
jgi:hypothetical protein